MKLTKRREQRLSDYVREVMDILHLKDWNHNVWFRETDHALGEDESQFANATAEVTVHRKFVDFTFDPRWLETDPSPSDIRQTVAHECVHCHLGEMWHYTRLHLLEHGDVTQAFYDIFIAGFEGHMEVGVDGLADAIAPMLPEFSW